VPHRAALALTIAASLWVLVLVAAPIALSRPSLTLPATLVYDASSRICHQRPERSFHLAGPQLPVCARCFGLYASGALGALAAWGTRRRVRETTSRAVLAIAALPTAMTWGLEVTGVVAFSNSSRAVAAIPLGLAAGWVVVQLVRYDFLLNGHKIYDRGASVRYR
jgi:uncharacterized membrane protein